VSLGGDRLPGSVTPDRAHHHPARSGAWNRTARQTVNEKDGSLTRSGSSRGLNQGERMAAIMTNGNLARTTVLGPGIISQRQFFFTETLPHDARNVRHAYAPVKKLGVLMDANETGRRGSVATFASTILRLENGRYRMYYTCLSPDYSRMGIAVAESEDAIHWTRVPLGPAARNGHETDRIVFRNLQGDQSFVGQPQVSRMPDGRWRMYFWKHREGHLRYLVAESDDGLVWTVLALDAPALYHPCDREVRAPWTKGLSLNDDVAWNTDEGATASLAARALQSNDATFVYYNADLVRYECYSVWLTPAVPDRRVEVGNAPGVHRTIQRRLSRDGLAWSSPELILMPDQRDPWDLQFYHMAVQWHEDWMVGSLGHYRVEDGQQTMDLELTFSRDGRTWHRPLRGGFIPRDPNARDAMGIYPPNAWVDRGDHWLCLYSATVTRHNETAKTDSPGTCIMGATFGKHRLAGLAAGREPGGFLSDAFFPTHGNITLDADIRGWLRAELCDAWGRKIDGFHLMDGMPVTGDSHSHMLAWRGRDTRPFTHESVRLRVEFADGMLYNIAF